MKNNGITLIELLVVISIIGILVLALGFSFEGWRGNYRIESQTKNLYADLMEARTKALTMNLTHFIVLNAADYQMYEDADGNASLDTGTDRPLWPSVKKFEPGYHLKMISAHAFPSVASPLTIDTRGLTSVGVGYMYFGIDHGTDLTPDYDCIMVSQSRIRMGKWDGGTSCAER